MDMLRVMKIAALLAVTLSLTTLTVHLLWQPTAPAASAPPCVAGDVNGDAALDIGDPIYLLGHLFAGGPQPIACAQGPSASEIEAALDAMFPSGADRMEQWFQIPANSPSPVHEVFVVPAGMKFVVERLDGFGNGSYMAINGQLIPHPILSTPAAVEWVYYPGESVQVFNPTLVEHVFSVRGYFVEHDSTPPTPFPSGSLARTLERHFPRQDGYEASMVLVSPLQTIPIISAPSSGRRIVVDWFMGENDVVLVRDGVETSAYHELLPMILAPGETISVHNLDPAQSKSAWFTYHTLALD